jgi:hypothetical protein
MMLNLGGLKMKKIIILLFSMLIIVLSGCVGDVTDSLVLTNGASMNTPITPNSLALIPPVSLSVTNNVPCNLFSLVVTPSAGGAAYGDLLGNKVIGIGNQNTIYGVPNETLDIDVEFSKTLGDPNFPSISIPSHNFTTKRAWSLTLSVGQLLNGVGPVDPNVTVIVQNGYVITIK